MLKRFFICLVILLAASQALAADGINLRIIYGSGIAGEILPCG